MTETPTPTNGWAISSLWTQPAEDRIAAALAIAEERVASLRRTLETCRALRAAPKPLPAARWEFASPHAIAQLLAGHPDGLTTPEIARRLARSRLTVSQALRRKGMFAHTADGRWTLRPAATSPTAVVDPDQQKGSST